MSCKILHWACRLKLHHASAKAVIISLAFHANPDHEPVKAWPSAATIADETGLDRKTIYRALQWLRAMNLIAPASKAGRATVYRLACDRNGKRAPLKCPKTGQQMTRILSSTPDPITGQQLS